ncbi:MAG: hypothetical protein IPN89_01955 [Saprospiraceae bacterium]|nr:hypothetical protein [Saprospiraceae bacterium]
MSGVTALCDQTYLNLPFLSVTAFSFTKFSAQSLDLSNTMLTLLTPGPSILEVNEGWYASAARIHQ